MGREGQAGMGQGLDRAGAGQGRAGGGRACSYIKTCEEQVRMHLWSCLLRKKPVFSTGFPLNIQYFP